MVSALDSPTSKFSVGLLVLSCKSERVLSESLAAVNVPAAASMEVPEVANCDTLLKN